MERKALGAGVSQKYWTEGASESQTSCREGICNSGRQRGPREEEIPVSSSTAMP